MKNMLSPITFVLLAMASIASADIQCTDVKPVDDFDMDKLLGGYWYENARYPTVWEDQGECTTVKYELDGDTYRFYISEVFENNHKLGNSSGIMEHANNDKSGVIKFTSSLYKEATGSNELTTTIVDVDYDHYVIFFECKYDPINKVEVDHTWIISRSKTVEPQAKAKLEEFFAKTNLDMDMQIWDRFSEEDCKFLN